MGIIHLDSLVASGLFSSSDLSLFGTIANQGALAIKNSILRAAEFCEAEVHVKIRDKVAELHVQEACLLGDKRSLEVSRT